MNKGAGRANKPLPFVPLRPLSREIDNEATGERAGLLVEYVISLILL